MASGLILLTLIAALITFGIHRFRRRMGMSVTFRMWLTIMAVVIIAVLLIYSWSTYK